MHITTGKRILMLLENNPYKQDNRVKNEAQSLFQAGYQVTVICPKLPGDKMHAVVDGVSLYQFPEPWEGQGFIGYVWEYGYATIAIFLLSLLAWLREGFDIVHVHNPPEVLLLIAAFYKLFGKRFLFDHHDLSPEIYQIRYEGSRGGFLYKVLLWLERQTLRLADHVIVTNASYKRIDMARAALPAARITIVRNGPRLSAFQPMAPDRALRRRAGTILGYVGMMGPQDGVDYFLRALHHLVYGMAYRDVYGVIIGDGPALPSLRALATALKLDEFVQFTGWISDEDVRFGRYLSTIDIGVDPDPANAYNDHSTMIKIMEYMAMGKPVVAFDLPEHRVTAAEAARYAQGNDVVDFARQIAHLIDHPDEARKLGEVGRQRVETHLAWHYQERQLLKAYELVAQSQSTGTPKPMSLQKETVDP